MATQVGNWGGGAVWRVASGTISSNAYFCEADVLGGCVLIDPGLDGHAIDAEMTARGVRPNHVFCTHGHFDHAGSAAYFQKKYGCQVFMHMADERTLKMSNFLLMVLKVQQKMELPEVSYVGDDFSIDVGGSRLTYLPAPGHTPGSAVIEFGSAWFTGDTIYASGVGLSSLPGGDTEMLKQSILGLWDRLTVERLILPGHGDTATGTEVRSGNHALLKLLGLVEQ